jgi:hypothetical protein
MLRGLRPSLVCAVCACALGAAGAQAESQLRLAVPVAFGTVPAATYDTSRNRIGAAHLVLEKLPDDHVRIFSDSGFDGGERTVASALLAPTGDRLSLQPVLQESKTFRRDSTLRGTLRVDHAAGTATCSRTHGEQTAVERIDLPASDRVANVALTLLFEPLVRGDEAKTSFQLMLCEGGARLVDFEAHVERRAAGAHGPGSLVEVRYRPDLGPIASFVAERLVPQLSFWFDPTAPTPWLAHRLPLYSDGPEVLVVREGVPTRWMAGDD